MASVPAGFTRRVVDGANVVLRDDVADALVAAGAASPESMRRRATTTYEGRGRPFGVDVSGAGRVFVRPYSHGGALRRVTGELYRGDARFVAELTMLVDAAAAGVRVAEPLGIVSSPAGLGMRRGWLFAREATGAMDVLAFLRSDPAPSKRRAVLEAAGRAIRTLFDAGFDHPDLHLKNLLAAPGGDVLVLDFDRVKRHRSLPYERRLAALFRFDRYAAKQAAAGAPVSRADRMRVLKACAGKDWPRGDELRALARRLARHVARHEAARR